MKKLFYVLTLLLCTGLVSAQTDFSGNWTLNRDKSQLGEQFSMAPLKIEITQEANKIVVTAHSEFQGQEFESKNSYTLDGKECENTGWMETITKSTATWSDDKSKLTIITKVPMQDGGEMKVTSIYFMKENNMAIDVSSSSSFGDFKEVQVYNKL